jgi:hypothetical protein
MHGEETDCICVAYKLHKTYSKFEAFMQMCTFFNVTKVAVSSPSKRATNILKKTVNLIHSLQGVIRLEILQRVSIEI